MAKVKNQMWFKINTMMYFNKSQILLTSICETAII